MIDGAGWRVFRSGCLFILAMLLGAALLAGGYIAVQQRDHATELDRKLNGEAPVSPRWLRVGRTCVTPTPEQLQRDQAMSDVARLAPATGENSSLYYAVRYFGWHWRIIGPVGRCAPATKYYEQLASKLERAGWPFLPEGRNDLELVEHLPPSSWLAERLAKLAFNSYPLTSEPLNYDNRPFARMLLGEQGKHALRWRAEATKEIAPDTKLGTSAAYLAVSIAPQEALPRVEQALVEMTAMALTRRVTRLGEESAFNIRDGYRLYELSHALGRAGSQAQPFSSTIIRLLDYKFASGSHFGLLFLPPTHLCLVARQIGGRALAAARGKSFCRELLR